MFKKITDSIKAHKRAKALNADNAFATLTNIAAHCALTPCDLCTLKGTLACDVVQRLIMEPVRQNIVKEVFPEK